MNHREFVEANWYPVSVRTYDPHEGYGIPKILLEFSGYSLVRATEDEAWAAAYEFTIDRLEDVRQCEVDIAHVRRFVTAYQSEIPSPVGFISSRTLSPLVTADEARSLCSWSRIQALLEAKLAELKQGMK